jgi:hypothetical protein
MDPSARANVFVLGTATPVECSNFILAVMFDMFCKIFLSVVGLVLLTVILGPRLPNFFKAIQPVKKKVEEKPRFCSIALLRKREREESGFFGKYME